MMLIFDLQENYTFKKTLHFLVPLKVKGSIMTLPIANICIQLKFP